MSALKRFQSSRTQAEAWELFVLSGEAMEMKKKKKKSCCEKYKRKGKCCKSCPLNFA